MRPQWRDPRISDQQRPHPQEKGSSEEIARVLVIVANRWDESAHVLASQLKDRDARVMTPRDLSHTGWRQRLGQPASCSAVIQGEVVPQAAISGVLTRLPCVFEEELTHIVQPDRAYVAAEMNAFLPFWLTSLSCPVLNRPAPGCLNGPVWRPAKWAQLAAQAGFFVPPFDPQKPTEQGTVTSITVIGEQCLGEADPLLFAKARRLAELAGVEMLTVRLSDERFLDVQLAPDLSLDGAASAIRDMFDRAARSSP